MLTKTSLVLIHLLAMIRLACVLLWRASSQATVCLLLLHVAHDIIADTHGVNTGTWLRAVAAELVVLLQEQGLCKG